jgi:hypothetical protein
MNTHHLWRRTILLGFSALWLLAVQQPSGEVRRGTGTWDAVRYGNHRAVIRVVDKAAAVWVRIPWRRRDLEPEKKNVLFVDSATEARIRNVCPLSVCREYGEFVFEPTTAPGDCFVYYLPYEMTGRSNYPTVIYPEFEQTAEPAWLEDHGLSPFVSPNNGLSGFPQAQVIEIQSGDEFNSFSPMEVIATEEETDALLSRYPDSRYLLFPEERRNAIRMRDDLPYRWIQRGPKDTFEGEALRGEFFVFQIGLWACRTDIEDVDVLSSGLQPVTASRVPDKEPSVPPSRIHSFNTRGVNWDGQDFKKVCPVPKGRIQPLWCGVDVPRDLAAGEYRGEIVIVPRGLSQSRVELILHVENRVSEDAGDSDLRRLSRLRWLNSRIAFDDETIPPYTPLEVSENAVSCLGRTVVIGGDGFPGRIRSFFSPEVTSVGRDAREILAGPISLKVEKKDGTVIELRGSGPRFTKKTPGAVAWEAESQSGRIYLSCRGLMEFDGFVEFKVELEAKSSVDVRDIRLEVPLRKEAARYMMGLGFKGGLRPARFDWKWDQKKNQDSLWIGDVNAGLQVSWRDENYSRPLNTNFYLSKPLNLPPSWWNGGLGGCMVKEESPGVVLLTAFSGPRLVRAGEPLHFHFNLLLTPFKPLDPGSHFATRYFHAFKPVADVALSGANTINVHHANEINPYINYPFLRAAEMKKYIDEAHARGMKVKIYNTIRELSNRCVELFALRSLGDEIFSPGPGGGFSWLQEHLVSDYIPAWFVPELQDAAIINSGMSRWHNYYLEGLNWLVKNVGIDGLYIDDVAFDRTTMKRARKILDRGRPGALIDLHSANQYNPRDGFASSANLYLEHFPFLNRLWFGEYFDYDSAPDYWLVEISGIPFGLMGEMLQDGGNAWRGMIYGMTNRLPWSGQNPARLWKVWDEFGIGDARMVGYWSPDCPVKTGNEKVLATAYVKKSGAMIALASWAARPVQCRLSIDWEALGIDPLEAEFRAPAIADFQPGKTFKPDSPIPVEPGRGWMLILKKRRKAPLEGCEPVALKRTLRDARIPDMIGTGS